MRGTRSGTGRHIPPGYVVRPGIIPKSHFLIGGYTSTDENLRGVPKNRRRAARTIYIIWSAFVANASWGTRLAGLRCALRCRRALPPSSCDDPSTPPRVCSLRRRNLERYEHARRVSCRVPFSFQATSHRNSVECSLFQSSIELARRPQSLQTACFTWFHPIFFGAANIVRLWHPTAYISARVT